MNKYLKSFLHRGLMFAGFGPVVVGIVYAVLERTVPEFSLTGGQICLAIVSGYLLAFVQAGVSVFNQIESWPLPKALLCHMSLLYAVYLLCYVLNSWIPFRVDVVLVFSGIFLVLYFAVWTVVYLCVRAASRRLNRNLS